MRICKEDILFSPHCKEGSVVSVVFFVLLGLLLPTVQRPAGYLINWRLADVQTPRGAWSPPTAAAGLIPNWPFSAGFPIQGENAKKISFKKIVMVVCLCMLSLQYAGDLSRVYSAYRPMSVGIGSTPHPPQMISSILLLSMIPGF